MFTRIDPFGNIDRYSMEESKKTKKKTQTSQKGNKNASKENRPTKWMRVEHKADEPKEGLGITYDRHGHKIDRRKVKRKHRPGPKRRRRRGAEYEAKRKERLRLKKLAEKLAEKQAKRKYKKRDRRKKPDIPDFNRLLNDKHLLVCGAQYSPKQKVIVPKLSYTPLIDTRSDCGFTFKQYSIERMRQHQKPESKKSESWILWINTHRAQAIDGFFDRLTFCKDIRPCFMTGSIEFWDGRKPIKPMFFEGEDMITFPSGFKGYRNSAIKKAFIKCIRGMDDFRAYMAYGGIVIEGYHRDGVNRFLIRSMSRNGEKSYNSLKERGKNLMDYKPRRYWFSRISPDMIDLDRKGRPIDNPICIEHK